MKKIASIILIIVLGTILKLPAQITTKWAKSNGIKTALSSDKSKIFVIKTIDGLDTIKTYFVSEEARKYINESSAWGIAVLGAWCPVFPNPFLFRLTHFMYKDYDKGFVSKRILMAGSDGTVVVSLSKLKGV